MHSSKCLSRPPTATLFRNEVSVPGEVLALDRPFYAFDPAEPLQPGEYELLVDAEGVQLSQTVSVGATTEYALDVEYNTSINEFGVGAVCCSTQEGGCSDTCGSCYSCWPERNEYARVVSFELTSTTPVFVQAKRLLRPSSFRLWRVKRSRDV